MINIKHNLQIETPQPRKEGAHSVTDLTVTPNISKFSPLYPKMSSRVIAADSLLRTRLLCAEIANNIKNLAMLTTCNQSHETQCILRANGIIKEDVSALAEGNRLVPVPMRDIGCEVGLHGGKWGECQLNIIMRIRDEYI